MNLKQLLEKAVETESFKRECYDDIESVFEDLSGFCSGYIYKDQTVKFALEDDVLADYVVFNSCPHYPGINMYTFDSIKEVESHLISDGSILNEFTGFSVVFHGNLELPYEIWFRNEQNIDTKFIKLQQKDFANKYREAVVKWLSQ